MKNINQFELEELTLVETRIVEGGVFNFQPMHIYLPQYPEIRELKNTPFIKATLWA